MANDFQAVSRTVPRCFNVKQAAERVGVGERTIRRQIDLGNLRAGRVGTRIFITEEALAEFIASCEGVALDE